MQIGCSAIDETLRQKDRAKCRIMNHSHPYRLLCFPESNQLIWLFSFSGYSVCTCCTLQTAQRKRGGNANENFKFQTDGRMSGHDAAGRGTRRLRGRSVRKCRQRNPYRPVERNDRRQCDLRHFFCQRRKNGDQGSQRQRRPAGQADCSSHCRQQERTVRIGKCNDETGHTRSGRSSDRRLCQFQCDSGFQCRRRLKDSFPGSGSHQPKSYGG